MRRGPKLTALSVLKARGSRQADRRETGVTLPSGMPPAPADLPPVPALLWEQIRAVADRLGISPVDESALVALVGAWADYQEFRAALQREGPILTTATARRIRNPIAGLLADAFNRYRTLALSFGITPGGRLGLHAAPASTPGGSKSRFFGDLAKQYNIG